MSITRFFLGLLLIAAIVTAGCTGPKTMVGTEQGAGPAGLTAAQGDYKKYSGELKDEIDYLTNHYKLSNNTTPEQYKAWLDGFKDRMAILRQMYNNTSTAAKTYLGYLNSSSDAYRNVTSDDAIFLSEIESLNQSYWQCSDQLNLSIKKAAALANYNVRLNATQDAYNDLSGVAKGAKVSSLDDYAGFLERFKGKAAAFEKCVDLTVAAGENYLTCCDPGSAEYKAVQDNDKSLSDSAQKCWDAYNKYKSDYDAKVGAKDAAQSTFKDYVGKVQAAASAKKDVDSYYGTAEALQKLDQGWLSGYRQKIDAFDTDANAAIDAGNACKPYLDSTGSDYKSITDNEKNMRDSMSAYDGSYNKLETTFRNLHPLGSLLK